MHSNVTSKNVSGFTLAGPPCRGYLKKFKREQHSSNITQKVATQRTFITIKFTYFEIQTITLGHDRGIQNYTLCVVGVDAGNAVSPSTGPPTSDGILYILHMNDRTIPYRLCITISSQKTVNL